MKILIDKSFDKDVSQIKDKNIRLKLAICIEQIQAATSPSEIRNLKKLSGFKNQFRIRIGDYRIGAEIVEDTLILIRFLHRKELYKFFP